jgi:hypothetical protein
LEKLRPLRAFALFARPFSSPNPEPLTLQPFCRLRVPGRLVLARSRRTTTGVLDCGGKRSATPLFKLLSAAIASPQSVKALNHATSIYQVYIPVNPNFPGRAVKRLSET